MDIDVAVEVADVRVEALSRAHRLAEMRKRLGLTQAEVADLH